MTTTGSLCTGYSGLDGAVRAVFGGGVAWQSDVDPGACAVLEHRVPEVPNMGDLTVLDWVSLPAIDLLCGGIPCQPFSAAGKRKGTADDRHLWPYMAAGISVLRPALVVIENVQGLVTRGLSVVLADLAGMGYDAAWTLLGASDAGAPHRRKRLFILAVRDGLDAPAGLPVAVLGDGGWMSSATGLFGPVPFTGRIPDHGVMADGHVHARPAPASGSGATLLPTPAAGNFNDGESLESWQARNQRLRDLGVNGNGMGTPLAIAVQALATSEPGEAVELLGTPRTADGLMHETVESTSARLARGVRFRGTLDESIATLRTPTAQLAVNGGSQPPAKRKAGGHGPTLADEIEHEIPGGGCRLPTPAARDFRSGKSNIMDRNARPLNEVLEHLPTPNATDGGGGIRPVPERRTNGGADHGPRLRDVAPTIPTPQASDWKGSGATSGRDRDGRLRTAGDADLPEAVEMLPTPSVALATGGQTSRSGKRKGEQLLGGIAQDLMPEDDDGDLEAVVISIAGQRRKDRAGHGQLIMPGTDVAPPPRLALLSPTAEAWGKYAPGVARWEAVLGRSAPPPTQPGRDGKPRLSPVAVEWLMGLPAGWVCDVPGLSRSQQLKLLGNGVVPRQAVLALAHLAGLIPARVIRSLASAGQARSGKAGAA